MKKAKKLLCLLSVIAIIGMSLPTVTLAQEEVANELDRLAPLYEDANGQEYSFNEMNTNPELLNMFFEENYENAEIISTTVTDETEQVWERLTDLNEEIRQLRIVQLAVQELENRLLDIQNKQDESVNAAVLSYQDDFSLELSELDSSEISDILQQLDEYDLAAVESQVTQCLNEYAALEKQLEELGAVPTQEELSQTMLSEQNAPSPNTEEADVMTFADPPDLSAISGMYTLMKSYCTITVSGTAYTTYTIRVQDKPDGNRMYQSHDWFNMYRVNTINPNAVNDFTQNLFEGAVVAGVGSFAAPYLGKHGATAAKWVIKAIFHLANKADTTIVSLYTNQPAYQMKHSHTAQMKFVYIQDANGAWWQANAANKAEIIEAHHVSYQYYDCTAQENRPGYTYVEVDATMLGRYSSAEVDAVNYYHAYISSGGTPLYMDSARSTVGSLEYIGKNNGEEITTKITPFYAQYPIFLI